MKKILLAMLLAVLCLGFAACHVVDGPGMENTETTTDFSSEATEPTSETTTSATESETTDPPETSETTTEALTETTTEVTTEAVTSETEPEPVETPITILERICSERDEISLTYVSLEGLNDKQIVVDSEEFLSRCVGFLYSYDWTEEPVLPSDSYVVPELYSIDFCGWYPTAEIMTFSCVYGGASHVRYYDTSNLEAVLYDGSETESNGIIVRNWSCSDDFDGGTFISMLRKIYFDLEFENSKARTSGSYDPSMVCESFVRKDYFRSRNNLCEGNHHRFKDYRLISYEIYEVNSDNTAFTANFKYAYVPEDWESPYIWEGNAVLGTEEYEGMLIESRSFVMELGDDVTWYCTEMGTGRPSLPQ